MCWKKAVAKQDEQPDLLKNFLLILGRSIVKLNNVITGALFLGFPMMLEGWFARKKEIKIQEKILRCILVSAAVNMIIEFVRLCGGLGWTTYEYFLADVELSIFLSIIVIPVADKVKVTAEAVLHAVCLMAVAAAVYSTLTYGQANIHSDTAIATILAQSQMRYGSMFPESWCYANGELWVLAMNIFVMPFSAVLHNQSLARALGSVLLIFMAMGGIFYQSRESFQDQSWMLGIPVFLLFLHGPGVWNGSADMILYQAAYTGPMLWMTVNCTLACSIFLRKNRKWETALLAVLLMLLCMGGIRYVAESVLPLWGACMVVLYMQNQKAVRIRDCRDGFQRAVGLSLVIGLPSAAGWFLYRRLCAVHILINTGNNATQFVGSLNDCWNNLIVAFLNMFSNFGFLGNAELFTVDGIRNMVSVFACILIVFVIPVLQLRRLREENEAVVFFCVFGVLHNIIMFLLAVFFGKISDNYLLTFIYVFIIISARYVMAYWLRPQNLQKVAYLFIFIASVTVQCMAVLKQSSGWVVSLEEKKAFAQELVSHGLHKGYATFWNAYANEVYSDLQLHIGGIVVGEDDIVPYRWLVDLNIFQAEDTDTFLLLSPEENDAIGNSLPALYGDPMQVFSVNDMYVYVFDHDIMKEVSIQN